MRGQTKQTCRPVTSAEAGGSGDAFPALQHFSRLSVDRANQLCPGPSIPVSRSPFLISTRAFPRARNNTLYSLPGTARSIATLFEEPPRQGHGSAGWLAGCRLPPGVCWWTCGLATIHLQHNSSTKSATVYTHAADGLDYLCECSLGGLVDHQQRCFMSLPRRSRYRGPACRTTTWPDMYDTQQAG